MKEEDIVEMARKLDGIEQHRWSLPKSDWYRTMLLTAYNTGSDYIHSNPIAVESYYSELVPGRWSYYSLPGERLVWVSLWSAVGGLLQILASINRLNGLMDGHRLDALIARWSSISQT